MIEKPEITIRECIDPEEMDACVRLQRAVFALPDLEVSPRRHLVVTRHAGGFILGAFSGGELVGFVLSVPGFKNAQRFFYSHMTAVRQDFQNYGVGARLKWAQRERALSEGVEFIKWTFQPVQSRNAHFNLERLGAMIKHYEPNFYGTDYATVPGQKADVGLDSDRLFAEWNLNDERVAAFAKRETHDLARPVARSIEIPADWNNLVKTDPAEAARRQEQVKREFQTAFAEGLIARGFERSETSPKYLLFKD